MTIEENRPRPPSFKTRYYCRCLSLIAVSSILTKTNPHQKCHFGGWRSNSVYKPSKINSSKNLRVITKDVISQNRFDQFRWNFTELWSLINQTRCKKRKPTLIVVFETWFDLIFILKASLSHIWSKFRLYLNIV